MVEKIYKHMTESHKDISGQMQRLRAQAWEVFQLFLKEYKRALRPKSFFGFITSEERTEKAFENAFKQTQIFMDGFKEQEENLTNSLILIAKESPEKFLSAVKTVLTEVNSGKQLEETGEDRLDSPFFKQIFTKMKTRKDVTVENEKDTIKANANPWQKTKR
jgi:hypothetical protein